MNVIDAINKRRSIRKFKDTPVEKEKIELLLRAAMQAPSGSNQQAWEFVVVQDKNTLEKLSTVQNWAMAMKNGALGIVVLGNKDYFTIEALWQQDLSAATQNILLTAVELELGATWFGIAPFEDRMENIRNILSLPDNTLPFNMLVLGYPEKNKDFEDRFKPEKVHYEKY